MKLIGKPRLLDRMSIRPVALIVALQLATSGLVLPAQAAHIDPERALINSSLPAPFITPRQVAQIMQAPAKSPASATTAGAKNSKGLASDVISGATGQSSEVAKVPANAESADVASAGASADVASADVASADLASAEPTTGESDWSADAADGQQLALNVVPGGVPGTMRFGPNGPIIIDNDEDIEAQATIEYEDLPTEDGGTKVKAGARFPVVVTSQISSRTAKLGDSIQARLKYDLKIGDKLIATKGSAVRGHISYALKARTTMGSLLSIKRFYRNSGAVGLAFDEIINEKGEHLPLVAQAARKSRIIKNKGEGRVLGVNHNGVVVGPWSQQLRYKAIRIGLNAALSPAGVFSFGAMPVALGLIGAANPSFAFSKPVGLNVRHRRLKGFAWGFLSGFPGSFLIEDTLVKGQEAIIKPGDEFLVEFRQEFNGEPATDAQLLPGASTKVRGQVLDGGKKAKKEKKDKDKDKDKN